MMQKVSAVNKFDMASDPLAFAICHLLKRASGGLVSDDFDDDRLSQT
jgi:hypothetical protein